MTRIGRKKSSAWMLIVCYIKNSFPRELRNWLTNTYSQNLCATVAFNMLNLVWQYWCWKSLNYTNTTIEKCVQKRHERETLITISHRDVNYSALMAGSIINGDGVWCTVRASQQYVKVCVTLLLAVIAVKFNSMIKINVFFSLFLSFLSKLMYRTQTTLFYTMSTDTVLKWSTEIQ